MSKILLYIDEDSMDEDFVQALRARNVDVLTVADVGMLNRSDEEQLNWAKQNSRVIFSFNARDFYRLHATLLEQGSSHSAIILALQQRYGIGDLMRGVLRLVNTKSLEEMQGRLEFLSDWII
jgi:predicted nuclease of predicted toxin-antitoxin system